MSEHLLYISIGPVQDFIASARKCQDLWYGSYLLSQLSEICALAIQQHLSQLTTSTSISNEQAPLIFPAELSHLSSMESMVANKILVKVPTEAISHISDIATTGKKAVQQRLDEECTLAFKKLIEHPHSSTYFDYDMAKKQLDELIEYAWIAIPINEYHQSRIDADAILAARKTSKSWTQISWNTGKNIPKSSLDGARESVIKRTAYKSLSKAKLRELFGLKDNEYLCGVGLLKRLGAIAHHNTTHNVQKRYRPTFHSTSHLAAMPLLTALTCDTHGTDREFAILEYIDQLQNQLHVNLDRYRIRLGGQAHAQLNSIEQHTVTVSRAFAQEGNSLDQPMGYDGSLFYESRLESILEESAHYDTLSASERQTLLHQARKALRTCLKTFHLTPDKLCKYYGFILADGDHMGAAIDALKTPAQHRELSRRLSDFAKGCRKIVENNGGSLLYAGGDDVLALVPLHTLIDTSCQLQVNFTESMAPFFIQPEIEQLTEKTPTLSVGVSIAHHLDSMSYALQLARQAERQAKNAGRDALSMIVSRRSGGEYTSTGNWHPTSGLPTRLKTLLKLIENQALPHGVSHELIRITKEFTPPIELNEAEMMAWREQCRMPLWREVVRILKRKRIANGQHKATEARDTLIKELEPFSQVNAQDLITKVLQLSDELLIAKLIWSGYQNAWSKK